MIKEQQKIAPSTEFSEEYARALGLFPGKQPPAFVKGMRSRMTTSYFKYGAVADAYPAKINAIESCQIRIEKYVQTGNTEFLMDAANFLMIEFMCPRHTLVSFQPLTTPWPLPMKNMNGIQHAISEYQRTGNSYYLVLGGKLCMEEFSKPEHPNAFFKATDASESPGRATNTLEVTHRANNEA